MYAARGASPKRFPWGDATGTCKEVGRLSLGMNDTSSCCGGACVDALNTGAHPNGNSPFGVGDVLAYVRELVVRGGDGASSMCGAEACTVSGFLPGAIDVLLPLSAQAFSFRCAWRNNQ
jgi:hypothetical protein